MTKTLNKIQGTLLKKHDVMLSEYMYALDLTFEWVNSSRLIIFLHTNTWRDKYRTQRLRLPYLILWGHILSSGQLDV